MTDSTSETQPNAGEAAFDAGAQPTATTEELMAKARSEYMRAFYVMSPISIALVLGGAYIANSGRFAIGFPMAIAGIALSLYARRYFNRYRDTITALTADQN